MLLLLEVLRLRTADGGPRRSLGDCKADLRSVEFTSCNASILSSASSTSGGGSELKTT